MFKALLTHPDAKPVLRDLITRILRIPVADVEVRNTELPIMEHGLSAARKEGMEKGLEKGSEEGVTKVAKKLLGLNVPIADIAEATGLSRAEIERLK